MSWKGFSVSAPTLSLNEVGQEIEDLSLEKKEELEDDIYGMKSAVKPDSSRVECCLQELTTEISLIPSEEKRQYLNALERCPDYVNDRDFRLLFLLSEEFDVKAAARRLVAYWDAKVWVFGEKRAFHPITLDDVTMDDDKALRLGGIRFLPTKAHGKRGILVIDRSRFDQRTTSRKSMYRFLWYMHHVALEDHDVRENGIVYLAGHPRRRTTLQEQDRKLDSVMLKHVRTALPVRISVVHHYLSSKILEYVVPVMMVLFGPSLRQRYVPHMGTEESFLERLEEYGVPKDSLPKDMGGTDDFDYVKWLDERISADDCAKAN